MKILLLLLVLVSCAQNSSAGKYRRREWKHWSDQNHNCLNTRAEMLKARSLVNVQTNRKGCTVVSGKWNDYYFAEVHTSAKNVDIDHLVPLKNAFESGGRQWNRKEKEVFANDPENLVITNKKYNRQKGAKGIDQWLPVDRSYACKYVNDWIKIKKKYRLKMTDNENFTVRQIQCPL